MIEDHQKYLLAAENETDQMPPPRLLILGELSCCSTVLGSAAARWRTYFRRNPEASRSFQQLPEASRRFQQHLGISRSNQLLIILHRSGESVSGHRRDACCCCSAILGCVAVTRMLLQQRFCCGSPAGTFWKTFNTSETCVIDWSSFSLSE